MRLIVIGGSGFIGTRLCVSLKSIQKEFQILDKVLSNTFPERCAISDVRKYEQLEEAITSGDVLVNLAAEHRDDVKPFSLYNDVNVEGARNVCKIAEAKNINKIIFTSTVAVYGFAKAGTDESGSISPFNEYGRSKAEAEKVYIDWQKKDAANRCLVIIRPTVVFGEDNRGNVYNLLKQIHSRRFIMFGNGNNVKSLAYVQNLVDFIIFSFNFSNGIHVYNYVDKPEYTMNELVFFVRQFLFGKSGVGLRLPSRVGYAIGYLADLVSLVTRKSLPISSVRVRKFMATTQFNSSASESGFTQRISIKEALERTLQNEFIVDDQDRKKFYSE